MSRLQVTANQQATIDNSSLACISCQATGQAGIVHTHLSALGDGAEQFEHWHLEQATVERSQQGSLSCTFAEDWAFGALALTRAHAITDVTRDFYQTMQSVLSDRGGFSPLRIWHYLPSLSDGQDPTPYQQFCASRAESLSQQTADYCAATVIGTGSEQGAMYFLASKYPGQRIDNPRQTNPDRYPAQYASPPPMFSRALRHVTRDMATLYISGTASIVGHQSQHDGDVTAQADETLENLRQVIAQAAQADKADATFANKSLSDLSQVKVYLRHPQDYQSVRTHLKPILPNARFFQGEICRPELLIEIEACLSV